MLLAELAEEDVVLFMSCVDCQCRRKTEHSGIAPFDPLIYLLSKSYNYNYSYYLGFAAVRITRSTTQLILVQLFYLCNYLRISISAFCRKPSI